MHPDTAARAGGVGLRCSALVTSDHAALLLRYIEDGQPVWRLPGGPQLAGQSLTAGVRRAVLATTGLRITCDRVAFLVETTTPAGVVGVEMVFWASGYRAVGEPAARQAGVTAAFVAVHELDRLPLRPAVAGHIRGVLAMADRVGAAYLTNPRLPRQRRKPDEEQHG